MGADIHVRAQHYNTVTKHWEDADYYKKNQDGTYEMVPIWSDRCYAFFSLLAGVRGTIIPIDDPRGFPEDEDVPEDFKKDAEEWGHSATWYTLDELLHFVSDKSTEQVRVITHKPIVDENGRVLRIGDQVLYVEHLAEDEEDEEFDDEDWDVAIDCLKELNHLCLNRLKEFEYHTGNPSHLRLLIFFDS